MNTKEERLPAMGADMNMPITRVVLLGVLGVLWCAVNVQAAPARQGALPSQIVDVEWALVSLQPSGAAVEDTTGLGLTLHLAGDGNASGSGGCNQFFGAYTAGGGQSLSFGPLGSTRIGCEPPIAEREQRYVQTLQDVSAYTLNNGQLRLRSGESGELIYTLPAGGQPQQLPTTGGGQGTRWLLLAAVASVTLGAGMRRIAIRRPE